MIFYVSKGPGPVEIIEAEMMSRKQAQRAGLVLPSDAATPGENRGFKGIRNKSDVWIPWSKFKATYQPLSNGYAYMLSLRKARKAIA